MNTPLFEDGRRGPACPSELQLDRWHVRDLGPADQSRLDLHVPRCANCQARLQERVALASALSESERRVMLANILKAVPPPAPRRSWWRRLFGEGNPMPAYAAAFALLLVFVSIRFIRPPEGPIDGLQSKGGLGLTVYRERDGTVARARSGEVMAPGDRLRFGVDVPSAGHIMIVGIEADGARYVCHPSNGSLHSVPVDAGATNALPGAIELDDSTGREELHLIHCPSPFTMDEVIPLDGGRLAERGCAFTSFELSKGGP